MSFSYYLWSDHLEMNISPAQTYQKVIVVYTFKCDFQMIMLYTGDNWPHDFKLNDLP